MQAIKAGINRGAVTEISPEAAGMSLHHVSAAQFQVVTLANGQPPILRVLVATRAATLAATAAEICMLQCSMAGTCTC